MSIVLPQLSVALAIGDVVFLFLGIGGCHATRCVRRLVAQEDDGQGAAVACATRLALGSASA